jgi:hypothetical protein
MERSACDMCYYRSKGLSNKMEGTCGKDGISTNPKNNFSHYNAAGKRNPGRPQKR